jgi:hypothetical protein
MCIPPNQHLVLQVITERNFRVNTVSRRPAVWLPHDSALLTLGQMIQRI